MYVCNHQFDATMFELAVRIIYNMHEILRYKKSNNIEIDLQLYQRMKVEYNYFSSTLMEHLEIIKKNVNSLSKLCLTHIDHFFKRTNFDVESKPYSCHLCGTGFTSEKAQKRHLRDKHKMGVSKVPVVDQEATN